jgi:YegS/Rv2252/BmrU family lipid kinase
MTAFVLVNPRSANGRTERFWPAIHQGLQDAFPLMEVAWTSARGQATQLVRQALRDGHLDIVVVGGDGTLNEAVNGFFERGVPVSPDAVLGFVASGNKSDFVRTLGLEPGYAASLARLKKSHLRRIDVGRVSCLSLRGEPLIRYFINGASFGLTGRILRSANRSGLASLLGRSFATRLLLALPGWQSPHLRLMADHAFDEIAGVTMVAVANGAWFGGGLNVAPGAQLSDGKFDIVVVGGAPRRNVPRSFAAIREGIHLSDPAVRLVRAARLTAAPTVETHQAVEIETDGETAGLLPATFEILPGVLNLRC